MSFNSLKLTSSKGDEIIANWDNVTYALKADSYLPKVDATELHFTNKKSIFVKESLAEIRQQWYTGE